MERELADAFVEAWTRGPHWREALKRGLGYLTERQAETVTGVLTGAFQRIGRSYAELLAS